MLARALEVTAPKPVGLNVGAAPTGRRRFVGLRLLGRPGQHPGPAYAGTVLLGASPELLVDRDGDRVRCAPFASSAPRSGRPGRRRAANGAMLAASGRTAEHQLVIDVMRDTLEPLLRRPGIAPEPRLHPHRRALASDPDNRPVARNIHHRIGSRVGSASDARSAGADECGHGADRPVEGRPRLLRRRGGLVRRPPRRRAVGGVDPLRAAVRRPAHRTGAFRRRYRRQSIPVTDRQGPPAGSSGPSLAGLGNGMTELIRRAQHQRPGSHDRRDDSRNWPSSGRPQRTTRSPKTSSARHFSATSRPPAARRRVGSIRHHRGVVPQLHHLGRRGRRLPRGSVCAAGDFRRGLARKAVVRVGRRVRRTRHTRLSWAVLNWNVDAIAL